MAHLFIFIDVYSSSSQSGGSFMKWRDGGSIAHLQSKIDDSLWRRRVPPSMETKETFQMIRNSTTYDPKIVVLLIKTGRNLNNMSLRDFFTVTEVKNGLSTLTRVQELVSVMQKQKDCVLNLAIDARQWSTVVETLAATENGDCLNHFVQLNGPSFLNQWLQECHKCDKDVSDNLVEGLMIVLLATLEKLPLDREKLIFSGVGDTVEDLLDHRNLNIKEMAKKLSDKWDYRRTISCHQREDDGTSLTNLPKPVAEANTTEEVRSTNRLSSVSPGRGTGDATCEVDTSCARTKVEFGTKHIIITCYLWWQL